MKCFIVVACLFLVGVAQANTIQWGALTLAADSGQGFASGDICLLVQDTGADGLQTLTASDLSSGFGVPAGGNDKIVDYVALGGSLVAQQSTLMSPNPTFTGIAGYGQAVSWGTGGESDLYLVIFNSSSIATATEIAYQQQNNIGNLQNNSNNLGIRNDNAFTYVPIPEPTTMALFLMGGGVLAFRRRLAKKS